MRKILLASFLFASCAQTNDEAGLRAVALATIQANAGPAYDVRDGAADNAALDMRVRFSEDGVAVGEAIALRAISAGRRDRPIALEDRVAPTTVKNRVSYAREGIVEWYVNGPLGLEQGFTIDARPEGRGELAVSMEVRGAKRLAAEDDGEVRIDSAHGAMLRYGKLYVADASGRTLKSSIEVEGKRITIAVDDRGAKYPVTIDPFIWVFHVELEPDQTGPNDWFGAAVAIDGDRAIVGAYLDDYVGDSDPDRGVAYGFQRVQSGWVASGVFHRYGGTSSQCGRSVAIGGGWAAVGCPGDDEVATDAGKVLIYAEDGSGPHAQLTASDAAAGDYFGYSVAFSGTTVIAGAPFDNHGLTSDAGSAYVFVRVTDSNWAQQAKLTASDYATQDYFGFSVGISGNDAIAGAYRDDNSHGTDAGAAYVFHRSGSAWSQTSKLTGSLSGASDWFGYSVDISGAYAIAGAPYDGTGGAAYVFFNLFTWSETARLIASDAASNDNFGISVALDGTSALVGARFDDWGGFTNAGSAYVFLRSGSSWTQQAKLTASDAASNDELHAVAISGDFAIAGARLADTVTGVNSGAAYSFERSGTTWSEHDTLTGAKYAPSSDYGVAVAIDGDTAVAGVGLNGLDPGEPGAYVHERIDGVWRQSAALYSSDPSNHNVGDAVAIDGDTIAVGAPGDDKGGPYGRVEIFLRYEGEWFSQLILSVGEPNDRFGRSVDLSGDVLAIGAPSSGHAYVYRRTITSWDQEAVLTPSDSAEGFGGSVAAEGATVAVGAGGSEAVYVFVESGGAWIEQQRLTAFDGVDGDAFGDSLALSGETLIVRSEQGAYVFTRSAGTWSLQAKLVPTDLGDNLYGSVAIDGDLAILGTPRKDYAADQDGSAYIFTRSGTTWSSGIALRPIAGDGDHHFGRSVAISGTTAIVGGERTPIGAIGFVKMYRRIFLPF